jgi:hypothetical protein
LAPALNRAFVEKDVAGERDDWRAVVHAEYRILSKTEIEAGWSATMAVFRDVRDAELATFPGADTVDVLAAEDRFAGDADASTRPARVSINSVCPFPSTPAMPTISPLRTSNDTPFTRSSVTRSDRKVSHFKLR